MSKIDMRFICEYINARIFLYIEHKVSKINDMYPPVLNIEQQVSPTSEHLLCVENVDIEFSVHLLTFTVL
jgi:hypothetical protein